MCVYANMQLHKQPSIHSSTHTNIRTHIHIYIHTLFFLRTYDPMRYRASYFARFLDHTQRQTTVCRTPLHKWSARRRDLYLTEHNTHNRHNLCVYVFVDLGIRHTMRMRQTVNSGLCVLIWTTTLTANTFIVRRTEGDMIQNVWWSSCKVPVF